nr:tryprostatin b 6-hydroxylase [Quercus suber]
MQCFWSYHDDGGQSSDPTLLRAGNASEMTPVHLSAQLKWKNPNRMLTVILIALLAVVLIVVGRPIAHYLQDAKGFRKYPTQNFLSGFSALAYGWEVGRSHQIFHTRRLHEQLVSKPVIRLGPNWLSFGRARAARDIYGHASPCLKGGIYAELQGGGAHMVNMTSRADHATRRKMVATSYAPRNTETWIPKVASIARTLISKVDAQCTAPPTSDLAPVPKDELTCDGNTWGMLFSFENVISIGLSKEVGFVAQGSDLVEVTCSNGETKNINFIDCLRSGSRATSTLVWDTENYSLLKRIASQLSRWYATQWERGSYGRLFVGKLTRERLQRSDAGEQLDDLFEQMIYDKRGDTAVISELDREGEVEQMNAMGISLVNVLYYLVKNREALDQVRAEVDAALAPDDDIAPWEKVRNLRYLKACVDESMRLSPPVATDLFRKTPPDQSWTVDGRVVPPNTNVSISAYTAHRDPEVFPDPEAFKPERWLISGDPKLTDMLNAFIPFSAGARGCIGRNITILVQLVYVATLVHRYDFALPTPEWELDWTDYFNLWPHEVPLKVWRRQLSSVI